MNHSNDIFERAALRLGYASVERYRRRGESLFEGIPLQGTSVLEVGCGAGAWAIWVALHGAAKSVGIEPEADGCTRGSLSAFRENVASLHLELQVEAFAASLQDFAALRPQFDVAILYNVINHLDERATASLHRDDRQVERYVDLLRPLRAIMKTGGTAVVADCARSNLWPALGLRSPFATSIEWLKHQNPAVWIRVFERAGFKNAGWRWSPLYPLGKLSTNPLVQYLTVSHFVLHLRAA